MTNYLKTSKAVFDMTFEIKILKDKLKLSDTSPKANLWIVDTAFNG